jgi:CheY-like chemotaxis protein
MSESPTNARARAPTSTSVSTQSAVTNFTPNFLTKSHHMSKKRILIVDDDVAYARVLKVGLERTGGYEVRAESRATQALSAAREFGPDFILLDVCMIDGDGGDVAFTLRKDTQLRNVPIVFLTSIVSEREAQDGALRGPFRFLAKPARLDRVIACIEKHVGSGDPDDLRPMQREST